MSDLANDRHSRARARQAQEYSQKGPEAAPPAPKRLLAITLPTLEFPYKRKPVSYQDGQLICGGELFHVRKER